MIDEKAIEAIVAALEPKCRSFTGGANPLAKAVAREFAEAALQALRSGSDHVVEPNKMVPRETEGWVLVPKEPTLAMCNAGWREIDQQGFRTEDTEVAPIYRAMLSAAGGERE